MKPFLVAAVLVAAHAIGAEAVQPCAEMGTYELPVKWRKRTDVSSCARFWASGRAIRIPADSPAVIHGIIDLGVADPGAGGGLVPPRARDVRSLAAARVEVGALALADAPLVGAPLAVDPVPSQQESSGSGAGTAPAWTKTAPPLGAVPPPTPLADPAQLASTFGTNLPTDMKSLPTSLPSDVPPPPAVPMVVAAGEPILLAPSDSAPQVQITQPPAVPVVGVSDGPNPMQLMPTPTNLPPPLVVPAVIVPDGSKMPGQTPAPTSLPPPLPVIPVIVNEPEPIMPSQTPTDLPPRPLATQFPPPILPILEPIITMPANAPSGSLPPPRGTESPREPIPIMPTNAPTPMPLAPTDPLAPILPPPIPIPGATPLPGPIGDGPTPSALPTDSPRPELPFPIPALLPEPMTKPMGAPTDMVQTDMPTPVPRPTPFLPPLLPPSGSEFMLPPTNLPPPPLETKTMPPLPPPGVTGIPIGPTPPPPGAIGSETSFANPLATPIFTAGPGSAPAPSDLPASPPPLRPVAETFLVTDKPPQTKTEPPPGPMTDKPAPPLIPSDPPIPIPLAVETKTQALGTDRPIPPPPSDPIEPFVPVGPPAGPTPTATKPRLPDGVMTDGPLVPPHLGPDPRPTDQGPPFIAPLATPTTNGPLLPTKTPPPPPMIPDQTSAPVSAAVLTVLTGLASMTVPAGMGSTTVPALNAETSTAVLLPSTARDERTTARIQPTTQRPQKTITKAPIKTATPIPGRPVFIDRQGRSFPILGSALPPNISSAMLSQTLFRAYLTKRGEVYLAGPMLYIENRAMLRPFEGLYMSAASLNMAPPPQVPAGARVYVNFDNTATDVLPGKVPNRFPGKTAKRATSRCAFLSDTAAKSAYYKGLMGPTNDAELSWFPGMHSAFDSEIVVKFGGIGGGYMTRAPSLLDLTKKPFQPVLQSFTFGAHGNPVGQISTMKAVFRRGNMTCV